MSDFLYSDRNLVSRLKSNRPAFQVAQEIRSGNQGSSRAESIYACGHGTREILTSSFKLHSHNTHSGNDALGKLLIDPWEVILTELSFMFSAPLVVARVKSDKSKNGYFIRTNITDRESEYILGERRGEPKEQRSEECLIPKGVRNELLLFYERHLGSDKVDYETPLALLNYSAKDTFADAFQETSSNYSKLIEMLRECRSDEERANLYLESPIHNPALLSIRGVAAIALYHIAESSNGTGLKFLGTVEIYITERIPDNIVPLDIELLGLFAEILSLSIKSISPEDFERSSEAPILDEDVMPIFQEYSKDLEDYLNDIYNYSGRTDYTNPTMPTESSLPDVFNDLYLQIRKYLPQYGYKQDDTAIAFVVSQKPSSFGEAARYYFPPAFLFETMSVSLDRERAKKFVQQLSFGRYDSENVINSGIPLDRGLLGYVRETLFPAITSDLDNDARILSYEGNQLEAEKFIFSQNSQFRYVIEIPLVTFSSDFSDERVLYPTSLIIFLSGDNYPTSNCLHHIYASAYNARYALAKAFIAESRREEQVQRISIIVHDIDRMKRVFESSISNFIDLFHKNGIDNETIRNELELLRKYAIVTGRYHQFSQRVTNRRQKDVKGIMHPDSMLEQIRNFQSMFQYVHRPTKWPGWAEHSPTVKFHTSYKIGKAESSEPIFKWPQGALFAILYNLAANAVDAYSDLADKEQPNYFDTGRPEIKCYIGKANIVTGVAIASFEIHFPVINLWRRDLAGISAHKDQHPFCIKPEHGYCKDCNDQNLCGPYHHASYILKETNLPDGKQGMRSCRQAIKSWYEMISRELSLVNKMKLSDDAEIDLMLIKAGRPEIIGFRAPVIKVQSRTISI